VANFQTIMRVRPDYRQFVRHRRLVHRGDAIVVAPNIQTELFSTDGAGFRHSVFRGETLAPSEIAARERYGIVLGSSHIFGLGLPGNENTIPSLLGERFGFPFANISLPEGNSRNLSSLLTAYIARAPRPPAIVIHFSGGDFTNFSLSSIADPVFGSPNLKQLDMAIEERGGRPAPETQIKALLAFTSLWTRTIVEQCRTVGIPILLGHDTTFFEKSEPSDFERECALGVPFNAVQAKWFDTHRTFVQDFYARRETLAEKLKVPLVGPGRSNSLTFIDEMHYDREGMIAWVDEIAGAVEALLQPGA
jgi:hypothetical protein